MEKIKLKDIHLKGQTGKLAENINKNWLIGLRQTNPAILDMFWDRDVAPYRDLLPWSGEFAGKYITSAYFAYQLTRSTELFDYIKGFIKELIATQDKNGYFGCFCSKCQLTGAYSQNPEISGNTWDSWSHYHIMYGLLLWYSQTGEQAYLDAVEKAAHLFMSKFYDGKGLLVSIGSSEMNLSVYHVFALLYRITRNSAYLYFASKIENDLSSEEAGDYINYSLNGYEYYQCRKPRWESMHIIIGIAEMYRCTGKEMYLSVAKQIFNSILKTDVHNTGAFSTDEQAIGNPYKNSNIETCCVIAYNALGIELYKLTGELSIIDFLERSHYNAVLGYYSPTGRWSTYNTPMDGDKCANFHSINFQDRPGSPELNCCSVNAPRGVSEVSEWLLTEDEDAIYLNFYEDAVYETEDGIKFEISGGYPMNGTVKIKVSENRKKKKIELRIPAWSKKTELYVDGEKFAPGSGKYYPLKSCESCEISIKFDFTPRIEKGDLDCFSKSCVFIGPVLYGADASHNRSLNLENLEPIKAEEVMNSIPQDNGDSSFGFTASGVRFTDFYHLGVSGSKYKTWLPIE